MSPDAPTRTRRPTVDGELPPATSLLDTRSRAPAPTQLRDPHRYEKQGEHGRGGIGRVYRARDKELGRDVALKELITRNASSELRFFREALITARLEHPGIVPVHEAGRWPDGTPFYAMKLVAGRPLKTLIAERKSLGERLGLLRNVAAVAAAIAYAHRHRIIHRDLKPSNIMVGDFGETIVIDWGLAKVLGEHDDADPSGMSPSSSSDSGVTVAGAVLGTPAYMAPEQARGEPVDERCDVYAIGMILYDLCTGGPGFRADDSSLARTVDPDLLAIIARATDADPSRRYVDANAMTKDIDGFLSGRRVESRTYNLAELVAHWVRHNRRALAASIAILAVAASVVGWSLRSAAMARESARASRSREAAARSASAAERERSDFAVAKVSGRTDPTTAMALMQGPPRTPQDALQAAMALGNGVASCTSPRLPRRIVGVGRAPELASVTFATEDQKAFRIDVRTCAIHTIANPPVTPPMPSLGSVDDAAGTWRAWVRDDGRTIVRDESTGAEWYLIAHADPVRALVLEPSTSRLLTATVDEIRIWNLDRRPLLTRGQLPCVPTTVVPGANDASGYAVSCVAGDLAFGRLDADAPRIAGRPEGRSTPLVWSSDSICWGTLDGTFACMDRARGVVEARARGTGAARAIASNGAEVFLASENGEVRRATSLAVPAHVAQLDGAPTALAFATKGDLAVATRDGKLTFVRIADGTTDSKLAHQDAPTAIATTVGGDVLVASWDGSVSRWRDRTFRARYVAQAPVRDLIAIGEGFAANVGDATLWIESTELATTLELGSGATAIASSRIYAAAGTQHGNVVLVDAAHRKIASVAVGNAVTALAAVEDGRFAAADATGAFHLVDPTAAAWVDVPAKP